MQYLNNPITSLCIPGCTYFYFYFFFLYQNNIGILNNILISYTKINKYWVGIVKLLNCN